MIGIANAETKSESTSNTSRPPATSRNRRRTTPRTYAEATSIGSGAAPPGKNAKDEETSAGATDIARAKGPQRQARLTKSSEYGERIPVTGVRRIWGTLKSTPPAAVSAALNKLTTLGNQLSILEKEIQ